MSFRETDFLSTFNRNPQHVAFWAARYKHVSRLLAGEKRVIEIGCGNGFMGAMVRQTVALLVQTDVYPPKGSAIERWNPAEGKYRKGKFTAGYALDVLEHIPPKDEDDFLDNICASLTEHATLIIGMPSLESQPYASEESRREHRNCKTESGLRETLFRHFVKVYSFGIQDETLTTGFAAMQHYRLAICNTPR